MGTGISAIGERGLSGTFGFENNELHRKIYINDPENNLIPTLQELFGTNAGDGPKAAPEPFDSFYAYSVEMETADPRGSIGNESEVFDISLIENFPVIRGGVVLDILYRPLGGSADSAFVNDEGWDFSAQTMSLIGNNYGQNPQSLKWSDGTAITNITAIVKIIPKIDFIQTQVFRDSLPIDVQRNLIGRVNAGSLSAGTSSFQGGQTLWPPECVLLTGLPALRRWRFDAQPWFQWGVKLAINCYQDRLEDGSVGYVTWNRLYRPDKTPPCWDRVLVGSTGDPLYPQDDLSQVVA